jgi:hypothetical protein
VKVPAPRTDFFPVRKRDRRGGCCASRQLRRSEKKIEPARGCGSGNVVVVVKRKVVNSWLEERKFLTVVVKRSAVVPLCGRKAS